MVNVQQVVEPVALPVIIGQPLAVMGGVIEPPVTAAVPEAVFQEVIAPAVNQAHLNAADQIEATQAPLQELVAPAVNQAHLNAADQIEATSSSLPDDYFTVLATPLSEQPEMYSSICSVAAVPPSLVQVGSSGASATLPALPLTYPSWYKEHYNWSTYMEKLRLGRRSRVLRDQVGTYVANIMPAPQGVEDVANIMPAPQGVADVANSSIPNIIEHTLLNSILALLQNPATYIFGLSAVAVIPIAGFIVPMYAYVPCLTINIGLQLYIFFTNGSISVFGLLALLFSMGFLSFRLYSELLNTEITDERGIKINPEINFVIDFTISGKDLEKKIKKAAKCAKEILDAGLIKKREFVKTVIDLIGRSYLGMYGVIPAIKLFLKFKKKNNFYFVS